MNSFEAYCLYNALKAHFTTSYDYIKYGGKMNLSYDKFKNRNDKYFYEKLSKIPDTKNYLIASFLYLDKIYIKDILEKGSEPYLKWKKYNSAFGYNFKQELKYLDPSFPKNFEIIDNQLPLLLNLLLSNKISYETAIIILQLIKQENVWKEKLRDNIIWEHDLKNKIFKYQSFLNNKYNIEGRKILVDFYKNL